MARVGGTEELEQRLSSSLDRCQTKTQFVSWKSGNQGNPYSRYEGEADYYGPELWDLIERDWMNSAELAVRLRTMSAGGNLTGKPGFGSTLNDHWARHVHLYTNPLAGPSWDLEVLLCLAQARGRLVLLDQAEPQTKYAQALAQVNAAMGCF